LKIRLGKDTYEDGIGKLIAKRTPSNHRYYDESDLRQLYGIEKPLCRVSSAGQ